MKAKKYIVFPLIVFVLTGCFFPMRTTRVIGSGKVITESRRVANFSGVELTGVGTLLIKQGDQESLEITAEENIIEFLQSTVRGKNLVLGVQDFVSIDPREEIIYRLTVKELDRIETSGLGNVEIDTLKTTDLDLEISGSGSVDLDNLKAENFKLEVSGLGNINVGGQVEEQRVDLSGAGNYSAENLYAEEARIEISGTGQATVWVEKELDVEISGLGNLEYYGNPSLTTNMSGAGSIKSLGDK